MTKQAIELRPGFPPGFLLLPIASRQLLAIDDARTCAVCRASTWRASDGANWQPPHQSNTIDSVGMTTNLASPR
jgi:hypothetical protein